MTYLPVDHLATEPLAAKKLVCDSTSMSYSEVVENTRNAGEYILSCQQSDGAILWFDQGKLDPWDHTEAAMGLTICQHYEAAKRAYQWLAQHQNSDGSWYAKYFGEDLDDNDLDSDNKDSNNKDRNKIETNFVAYPATGLWHYYRCTSDKAFVTTLFPCVEKAIDYVLAQQADDGDIQWALSSQEELPRDALVTACASILRSLECAISLAKALGQVKPHWHKGYLQLADALKNKPWRFDRTWESKERFSMDWFYPILSGIYTHDEAQQRLDLRWSEFVEDGLGCRCVSDEPWITIAESCELTLALIASDRSLEAQNLYRQLLEWQDQDGGFWTGYSFRDNVIWPREKTSWTAAAILLASDALFDMTPASQLFISPSHLLFTQNT